MVIKPSMARQLSHCVSDAVLAASAFRASYVLFTYSLIGMAGFILQGIAASYGAFRYFQSYPTISTISAHRYYTRLTACVGLLLIAAAYHYDNSFNVALIHVGLGVLTFVLGPRLNLTMRDKSTNAVGAVGVISIFLWSVYTWNVSGMFGSILYMLAAVKFNPADNRLVFGVSCMDIFHCLLALANVFLPAGLMID